MIATHPLLSRPHRSVWSIRPIWLDLALVLFLVAVALFFRVYHLSMTPPGLYGDESWNGLDTRYTIPQSHPIFLEQNNGREPLFLYLQYLSVLAFGPGIFALRIVSVVVGTLTVVVTYWVGRCWFDRLTGFFAAAGLATSFWYVEVSRMGLRTVAAPLWVGLALLVLWYATRRGSVALYGLAGLVCALGLYTYLSNRLEPLLIVAIVVWQALAARGTIRKPWLGLAVLTLVTIVVVAPLALFFAQHPADVIGRAAQVSILNPNPQIQSAQVSFVQNLLLNLGVVFVHGDFMWRLNLSGRPTLSPLGAPWFLVGLILAGIGLVRVTLTGRTGTSSLAESLPSATGRAGSPINSHDIAGSWLLLWAGTMLLAGVLAYESPSFDRLSAVAPAIYLIWGYGLAVSARWLGQKLKATALFAARPRLGPAIALAIALLILGNETYLTYRDYFLVWAGSAEAYQAFDAGLTPMAGVIQKAADAGATPVLYVFNHRAPTLNYLAPSTRAARWVEPESRLFLVPAGARSTISVFSDFGPNGDPARQVLAGRTSSDVEHDPAGRLVFDAYHLTAAEVDRLRDPIRQVGQVNGSPDTGVKLLGVDPPPATLRPGDELTLTVAWQSLGDADVVYAPYVHVVDDEGRVWVQDDQPGYAIGGWRAGDLLVARHTVQIPVDAPPLTYHLQVGMATRGNSWPPTGETALGTPVDVGVVQIDRSGVAPASTPLPPIADPVEQKLGGGLTLVGYDRPAPSAKPGDRLAVDLLWQALMKPRRDLLIDLTLESSDGRVLASERSRPDYGDYPTLGWQPGTLVLDPQSLTIPGNAPAGGARLVVETLDASTGRELGQLALGQVQIVAPPRTFALPPVQRPVNVQFGGAIALKGYDLSAASVRSGGEVKLTLYWQDLTPPTENYTVFAHLLDSQQHIVAQQDSPPQNGQAPTLGWVPGQVIRDGYDLRLGAAPTSGQLTLEVGLYDPITGARLKLANGSDRVILTEVNVGAR